MQENARLLMEETGCEQGEAELALELANQNLENAIKTIESLLRHISVIKAKICFKQKNLYGLMLVVVNTKTEEILRLRTVVSYNPGLYENSPKMDWYALEKLIFSYRLDEGSLPDFTQGTESQLKDYLQSKKSIILKGNVQEITKIVSEFFSPQEILVDLDVEELNLAQFRKLPREEYESAARFDLSGKEPGLVSLEIQLVEDADGKEITKLSEGEAVLSLVTDTRDIAHYLSHLIGSKKDGNIVPLPAVIKKISIDNEECAVQVFYAPGIVGVAKLSINAKIKAVEKKGESWWKKIIPW